jgi:hypothetical protein
MKKTISVKQFIIEFGENFSKHMKLRLMELGTRCILTRTKENSYILDLKHIEHIKYDSQCQSLDDTEAGQMEYAYGQFVMHEGVFHFAKNCAESVDAMQAPIVSDIYNSLQTDELIIDEAIHAKEIDDSNIDFVIDSILNVCPEVSQAHQDILSKYLKKVD